MKTITICMCLLAIIAVGALLLLLYFSGANTTGAVSTGICPQGYAPILAEGPGRWREEIAAFEARGYQCFWGYDGITPCCGPGNARRA